MREQIAVADLVETATLEEEANVPCELFAACKRVDEIVHDGLLLIGEPIRVIAVDGGEVDICEFVDDAIDGDGLGVVIDEVQELPVFEPKTGVLVYERSLDLELQNRHCLLNLDVHFELCVSEPRVRLEREGVAGVIGVGGERKPCEGGKINAV